MVEKEFVRPYASDAGAEEIFRWLPLVVSIARAFPGDEQTVELLEVWGGLLETHIEGNLLADRRTIKSTDEQKAEWSELLKTGKDLVEAVKTR